MKTKLRLFLLALAFGLTIQAQTYDISLVRNSDYNFSVVVIPDYAVSTAPFPTCGQLGFTIMVPDGVTFGPVSGLGATYTTSGVFANIFPPDDIANRDAYVVSHPFSTRANLGVHVIGTPISNCNV